MLAWWGDVGSNAKTNDTSVVGDVVGFSILPGSDDVYNAKTGAWEKLASGPNFAPNMAYIGWGVYVMATRRQRREEAARRPGAAAAHLGGKDISLWMAAYPSGFQPYRNSPLQLSTSGWRPATTEAFIEDYLELERSTATTTRTPPSSRASPASSSTTRVAEDELAKVFAGQVDARRTAPTPSRPPGRRSPTRSAATARSSSTRPRSACSDGIGLASGVHCRLVALTPPADLCGQHVGHDQAVPMTTATHRRLTATASRSSAARISAGAAEAGAAGSIIARLARSRRGRSSSRSSTRLASSRLRLRRTGGRRSTPMSCGRSRSASARC